MTDKVQKIREEVEKLHGNPYYMIAVKDVLAIIDSLQEESVPKIFEDMLNAKTPAESLGISAEEHEKIIDLCLYGKEPEMVDIDNLPKEEPVSDELEEAMQHNAPDNIGIDDLLYWRNGFIAGAQWQKQQGQSTIELAEDHAMLVGMEKMKEQMMANAIEGVVHHFEKCKVASVHYNDPTGVPMAYFISSEGLSAGDKVKIIVIKEG